MVAAVIFVLLFLVLGLGVVFLAFSGRGSARRGRGAAPTPAGRRFVAVVVGIVIVGLGLAVPLAIGVVNSNDHAESAPGGVDLNASETAGRSVFAKNCATCHTLKASNAVARLGPTSMSCIRRRGSSSTRSRTVAHVARARCPLGWSTARTRRTSPPTSRQSPAAASCRARVVNAQRPVLAAA